MIRLVELFVVAESIDVFRGIHGMHTDDLMRLIGGMPDDEGSVDVSVTAPSGNEYWTTRPGLAMVYAGTDSVAGSRGEYQVLLRAVMPSDTRPVGSGGIVRLTKGADRPKLVKVAYTRERDYDVAKKRLIGLIAAT